MTRSIVPTGRIRTREDLRRLYREPAERVVRKELDRLDVHCRSFIAAAPFLVLATGGSGGIDVSPRGDAPGFVEVVDERTLLIPDRPGNNRLDSLTNLLERGDASVLFMIPGVDETLRVRGTVVLRDDRAVRERFTVGGRLPALVLEMSVRTAFLHCAKAYMRSRLWDPASWPAERPVPSMGEMIHDHIAETEPPESQEAMLARYREGLY